MSQTMIDIEEGPLRDLNNILHSLEVIESWFTDKGIYTDSLDESLGATLESLQDTIDEAARIAASYDPDERG